MRGPWSAKGYGKIKLGLEQARPVIVKVLVLGGWLLGFDLLLGIDAIKELGGVHLTKSGEVHFGNPKKCATISIDEPDFSVTFDWNTKAWTASWKWVSGHSPTELANRAQEYRVPDHVWDVYEEELSMRQYNGWLLPYPEEELGLPKGLIPLIAVAQEHKQKVRPVLNYRELNGFVEAFTANAEVCSQRLRERQWHGANVWTWEKPTYKSKSTECYGLFKQWLSKVSSFALQDWVSAKMWRCLSWNLSSPQWGPKIRKSRVPRQHMTTTFSLTKVGFLQHACDSTL